jgi:hypothetical protein
MLFSHLGTGKIFVSIAALMDLELEPTIIDLLEKAHSPEDLFISVYCQDDNPPNLEPIFKKYGASYKFLTVHYELAKGVGHARMISQSLLTNKYKYFLQIDSHMRFAYNWDTKLIRDYNNAMEYWGPMIFSTYPESYELDDNGIVTLINEDGVAPVVRIVPNTEDPYLIFKADYVIMQHGEHGIETGYFCAGFAFGLSEYFLQVPPDPRIYFSGEEHTTSIRFFQNGIRIVAPAYNYTFHDYDGTRRKRRWELPEGAINRQMESGILVRRMLSGEVPMVVYPESITRFLDRYLFVD